MSFNGVGWCTATLVAPNVLLSAAHCVKYGWANPGTGPYGTFTVTSTDGYWAGSYTVDGYKSWSSSGPSVDDISLVHLSASVPSNVATPIPLASAHPAHGTSITMYGYGCTDRGSNAGAGVRRSHSYPYGDGPNRLCPGDSGGPHLTPAGQAMRVNSGSGAYDTYADTVNHYGDLAATIASWPAPPPGPQLNAVTSASYTYHLEVNRALVVWGDHFTAGGNTVTITQGAQSWTLPSADGHDWWNGGDRQINTVLPAGIDPMQSFLLVVGGPGGNSSPLSLWASCAAGDVLDGSRCTGP